jgi:negative regulator of genetic competence, sporulation and motility
MSWLETLGAIGGTAGLVALIKVGVDIYMAKSGKTKVDVANMKEMLDEAHKMYDTINERYNNSEKKFEEYKEEVEAREERRDNKIGELIKKFNKLERTVTQAYRCKYPENIQDCPVVKSYEEKHLCEDCGNTK